MPARKSLQVPTLWELSLSYVSSNLDIWCNEVEDALSEKNAVSDNAISRLPNIIKNDIHNSMRGKNIRPNHLNAIIHPYTTHVDFEGVESRDVIVRGVELICNVCKNLTSLNLGEHRLDDDLFPRLMKSIPTVQYLNLVSTGSIDYELQILGEYCHNLVELDLRGYNRVTDDGIEALCVQNSGKSGGRCRLLRSLLIYRASAISENGAKTALRNLPELRRFDYYNILPVLETVYEESGSDCRLKLQSIFHNRYLNNRITNSTMDAAVALCEDINEIDITCVTNSDEWISRLGEFSRLEKLSVLSHDPRISYHDRIAPILERNGSTLKKLYLANCEGVDLWHIGACCGSLSELYCAENSYYSHIVPRAVISNFATAFCKLHEAVFNCFRSEDVLGDQMEFLLANCSQLQCLKVYSCQTLNDQLLQRACDVNSFSELRTLSLYACNNVHESSISLFAIRSASLRRIDHRDIKYSDIKALRRGTKRVF